MKMKRFLRQLAQANRDFLRDQSDRKRLDRRRKEIDYYTLHNEVHRQARCCFVLSTGRCGTLLLDNLFSRHPGVRSYHEPRPELIYHSRYAYLNRQSRSDEIKALVDGARYEVIRDSYLLGKLYAETNNRITFFAFQLAELFPGARFIHLVRHPLRVIESGLKRSWYTGTHLHDEGRIQPRDAAGLGWDTMNRVQKIAWLWNETNDFIEDFKEKHPDRVLTVRAEDLFRQVETSQDIFRFITLDPPAADRIRRLIAHPVNVQKNKPRLRDRPEEMERLSGLMPLASRYGYTLE